MSSPEVIEDLLPAVQPGRVLLIAELPGTNEFPQLIADLVVNVLADSQPIVVGLEVPFNEPLDGEEWGPFWLRDPSYADARSSLAMAELVTTLADLRAAGFPLVTVGLDGVWVAPGSPVDLMSINDLEVPRDTAMAGHFLAAMDENPGAAGIILAGKEHTGVLRGTETMGSIVTPWFSGSIALLGTTSGGTALSLLPDGPMPMPVAGDPGLGVGAVWSEEPGADGHHGFVNPGPVTAAAPFPHG